MKYILIWVVYFLSPAVIAQSVLQNYISQGLENNLALKLKETSFRHSLEALKEARGMFFPALSLNARYTISEGGRVIEFPVGDLLNPVYTTLNQLTASNAFPMLENEEIRFLRPTEHETKLRLVQPVFNTDLYFNAKIKKELTKTEEISLEQYKRELIAEIKKSYYTVGMTSGLLQMLKKTRYLLLENVRVNARLFENNKITKDNLYRSHTELSKLDQQLRAAEKNKQVASAYFNFLLNRSLSDSIIMEEPVISYIPAGLQEVYTQQAVLKREEIKNLDQYNTISDLSIKMNRSSGLPNLFVLADYGFQGEKYRFDKDHDYIQASVILSWDLFSGFQNKARIGQALMQKEMIERRLEETKSQIELQVINSMHELTASEAAITAAEDQARSAREGFRLMSRKYEEGQASLIEFIDARNALTQAEENLIISRYTYLSNLAEFEKTVPYTTNR
jgi:outer membrane protein TolC